MTYDRLLSLCGERTMPAMRSGRHAFGVAAAFLAADVGLGMAVGRTIGCDSGDP